MIDPLITFLSALSHILLSFPAPYLSFLGLVCVFVCFLVFVKIWGH